MADTKITGLQPPQPGYAIVPSTDVLPIVVIADPGMAASGSTRKATVNQILGAGGTATLASATITGAATAASLTVTGSSIPTNGLYLPTTNTLEFAANSLAQYRIAPLGVFLWYDGAGGTRMTLNSTGLGVGGSPAEKLTVSGNIGVSGAVNYTGSGEFYLQNTASTNFIGINPTSNYIRFGTNNTVKAIIDSSGNFGVGVTPSAWGATYKAVQLTGGTSVSYGTGTMAVIQNSYDSAAGSFRYVAASSSAASFYQQTAGTHEWSNASAGTAGNLINGGTGAWTSRMLLDASGRLFVGKTSSSAANTGCELQTGTGGNAASVLTADGAFASIMNRLTSDGIIVDLRRETLSVGNISVTTTGATFNSTSDYRLKESVSPLSGGLARVNALKPSVYKWKSNGSDGEGFLAHELAEVVPAAVNGEKDAVNEDGTIKAQSIDMSRVVPILVAAIKELTARVEALEA